MKYHCAIVLVAGFWAVAATAQQAAAPAQQTASPAQQTGNSATASSAPATSSAVAQPSTVGSNGTSTDRLLFALPNFLTLENAGQVPPMTAGQKFKATARGTFDYMEFAWGQCNCRYRPSQKQRTRVRPGCRRIRETFRRRVRRRHDPELHDEGGAAFRPAPGSSLFPVRQRKLRTPEFLRAQPCFHHPLR